MSIEALTERVLPSICKIFKEETVEKADGKNVCEVEERDGFIVLRGDCDLSRATALGLYIKRVLKIDWAWCGNRRIDADKPVFGFEKIRLVIEQKYRVYLNYCTLCYSMSWWDFDRWEKEIDFMALNGVNMPLSVVGSEAVWFYTFKELGLSEEESLKTVSAPSFWAWQAMSNIDGYQPPASVEHIKRRAQLGKKIIEREVELGMMPIQQGFSGHVPAALRKYYPEAVILDKPRWCGFRATAQLDPLDPLFGRAGKIFLKTQKKLFGSYGFFAADPFHEGAPPRKGGRYLRRVGQAIDGLFENFDKDSKWVMQSWSMRRRIVKAVPRDRLLILDIDGKKREKFGNFWGYEFVVGRLHNFGGKNSLHGGLAELAENPYLKAKKRGNAVGTGLFPEGIEQNPVYYALAFDVGVSDKVTDIKQWLADYCRRRYGSDAPALAEAMYGLLNVCYKNQPYERESGSIVCARPSLMPKMAACNDVMGVEYDNGALVAFIRTLLSSDNGGKDSDGRQFDLCDFTRQALSNLIVSRRAEIKRLFEAGDAEGFKRAGEAQIEAMTDLDGLLSHRSELCLSRWINDAHRLAADEKERAYFDRSARMLLTVWGDFDDDATLFDYAWREWNGLISEFYIPRWKAFFEYAYGLLKRGEPMPKPQSFYFSRPRSFATEFDKRIFEWEKNWVNTYSEYPEPTDTDVTESVRAVLSKYFD